jgi:hypothetical protein
MSYLMTDLDRDAELAEQYLGQPELPFWAALRGRAKENQSKLLQAVRLAKECRFETVRGNMEPGDLNTLVARWGTLLKLDTAPFEALLLGEKDESPVVKGEWKLAFEDQFHREQLGDAWRVVDGNFTIRDGHLTGNGELYVVREFKGPQKVEFTAQVDAGRPPCDLSAILCAQSPTRDGYDQGYFFGLGNRSNVRSVVMKEGKRLCWWVDDKKIVDFTDFGPLDGNHIGFYIYSEAHLSDVKVYSKTP